EPEAAEARRLVDDEAEVRLHQPLDRLLVAALDAPPELLLLVGRKRLEGGDLADVGVQAVAAARFARTRLRLFPIPFGGDPGFLLGGHRLFLCRPGAGTGGETAVAPSRIAAPGPATPPPNAAPAALASPGAVPTRRRTASPPRPCAPACRGRRRRSARARERARSGWAAAARAPAGSGPASPRGSHGRALASRSPRSRSPRSASAA